MMKYLAINGPQLFEMEMHVETLKFGNILIDAIIMIE